MRGREASSDATANSGTPQYMRRNLSQQTAVASPSDTPVDSIANMDHDPSERVAASDEEKAAEAGELEATKARRTNKSERLTKMMYSTSCHSGRPMLQGPLRRTMHRSRRCKLLAMEFGPMLYSP